MKLALVCVGLLASVKASVLPVGTTRTVLATINSNNTADCTNCTNTGNSVNPIPVLASDPVVSTKNGSYAGVTIQPIPAAATLSGFGTNHTVEAFLGMPYARQPGPSAPELRFARPEPLNESWSQVRSAKRYSQHCYGTGTDNDYNPPYVTYQLGESCLTLNVVRPAQTKTSSSLPVFVWIHGGGFGYGGSGDVRYNASFIVDRSITLDTPVMFVSLNYRTNLLGFPTGQPAHDAGIENLGLYDQRQALRWIQENIADFGGDPTKVTVVGESAGGASVFHLLTAYHGRQDNLFRAVISESGYYSTTPPTRNITESRTQLWNSFVDYANCTTDDTLACLRALPLEAIKQFSEANAAKMGLFNPVVDGDMVSQDLQSAFLQHKLVPSTSAIFNANLDEGISFGVRNLNTTKQIFVALNASQELPDGVLTSAARKAVQRVYPDNEDIWPPFQAGAGLLATSAGSMDRRSCALFGDLQFIGPKREASTQMAQTESAGTVYNSRFDQLPYMAKVDGGAQHFTEVAYVFRNPLDSQNALGPKSLDVRLANVLSSYWISFVATGDPNTAQIGGCLGDAQDGAPYWPPYSPGGDSIAWVNNGLGVKTRIVPDTYRTAGIQLLMSLRADSFHTAHSEL